MDGPSWPLPETTLTIDLCIPMRAKSACRLFVVLARDADVGVILRRGPTRWVQMIKWDDWSNFQSDELETKVEGVDWSGCERDERGRSSLIDILALNEDCKKGTGKASVKAGGE